MIAGSTTVPSRTSITMTIFQIEDSRPFLTHNGLPIQWHTGSAPWWGMTSRVVRINSRGIAFKPHPWHTRVDLMSMQEWTHEPCPPSGAGLCSTRSSVMFPSQQTPVVNEALDWICSSTATYRSVTNASRYDTSACDVLDAKADFVLADETLFRSNSSNLPEWIYWTVCVMVVYLVRCLSKYVLASLNNLKANEKVEKGKETKDDAYPNSITCVSACAFTCILVISQGDFIFVTEEELLYHRFTLFYIASYALLFIGNRLILALHQPCSAWNAPPFYNLLAGIMLLVASRLYCGAETPYNPPLIFIIAMRIAVKSRRGSDILRSITLLLDSFMVSLVCILGFSTNSRYLIALFAAAGAAADVLV
jgi:hypothetical protein